MAKRREERRKKENMFVVDNREMEHCPAVAVLVRRCAQLRQPVSCLYGPFNHPFQRSKTDTSNIGLHVVLVGCDSSSA